MAACMYVCVCEWHVFVCLAALLHAASRVYSTGNTCLDLWMSVVILFQIATPSTFFIRFLQNMTLMYCAQNCGTDFQNMLLKFSAIFYILNKSVAELCRLAGLL